MSHTVLVSRLRAQQIDAQGSPIPFLREPFARPEWAVTAPEGTRVQFKLPSREELERCSYLTYYKDIGSDPAKDEFDILYFVTARFS